MGRVNNDCQNDCAEIADRGALQIDHDRCQGARREGDEDDDDTCLHHWFGLISKVNFITEGSGEREKGRRGLEGECWRKRLRERKEQWLITMAL
jgi:hypothetical protein